jgi:cytochrome c peroxidase
MALCATILGSACFAQSQEGVVDLTQLPNYSNQELPSYIDRDNTPRNNPISDMGAMLGRVLFYDKRLSRNDTVSCSSCHQQEHAFGDPLNASLGVSGTTGRHSMRLINVRFGNERRMFWDERADSVEDQATRPIQDHIEMGFSGTVGDPDFSDLAVKLAGIEEYQVLFNAVFGDLDITEQRIQRSIAQFVRSIQSFDSRFDEGLSQVSTDRQDFPNYSDAENRGKRLFLDPRAQRGAGCAACHRPPEFDINPNSQNNGVTGTLGGGTDFTVTRSPSLRDLVGSDRQPHSGFMHNASLQSLLAVVNHYDGIQGVNPNLDRRLSGGRGRNGQNLNLSQGEKSDLVAFLETLTGNAVYTDEKWSDPFHEEGQLRLVVIPSEGTTISGNGNNRSRRLRVRMRGVPNVRYLVQQTKDFKTWTSIPFRADRDGIVDQTIQPSFDKSMFCRVVYAVGTQ